MNRFALSLLLLGVIGLTSAALPRITIKGQRMFTDTGDQFFCRGLAYAPQAASATASPLTNLTALNRDILVFKRLNINCLRVYQFFATDNLAPAMAALDAAGIYLLVDLYDPTDTINRAAPLWTSDLFAINKAKINKLLPYTNLLGIIAGNEVTNDIKLSPASAYVKAAIRDVKAYIKTKNVAIPVGYAGADDATIRDPLLKYFTCGSEAERADFFGINIYRWCGNDLTFTSSTYDQLYQDYSVLPIPALLTEFGCIIQNGKPFERNFTEVPVLFGPQMNDVFSGGIAYEYHTSGSSLRPEGNYGIANYSADESTAFLTPEGTNLGAQYDAVKGAVGKAKKDAYTPVNTALVTCPAKATNWLVNPTSLPPTPDIQRCQCLANQFKCRTTTQDPTKITPDYGTKIGGVIGALCGRNATLCTSIGTDATTGVYGTWSMCSSLVRASLLMNYVYQATGSCDFSVGAGFEEVVEPTAVATCQSLYPNDSADLSKVVVVPPPVGPVDPGNDGGAVTPSTPAVKPSGGSGGNGGSGSNSAPVVTIGSVFIIALIASL